MIAHTYEILGKLEFFTMVLNASTGVYMILRINTSHRRKMSGPSVAGTACDLNNLVVLILVY